MTRSGLALALAVGLLAPGVAGAEGAPAATSPARAVRRLAVVPFYAPEQLWRRYQPLVEYLRAETGDAWELALHPTHDALVDEFCAGRVDVALLGPMPLARVHRRCAAEPVLVALGATGDRSFRSLIVTADPGIRSLAALRGKEVGFFRGSTAAHGVPAKLLADAGLPPGSYGALFLESQDRIMTAVLAGKVAAGGVKSALHDRFAAEPGLRVLATSDPLPNFCFAAPPSLEPAARERFAAALLRLHPQAHPADAAAVSGWDDEVRHGFVRPDRAFLPSVLKLAASLEQGAP